MSEACRFAHTGWVSAPDKLVEEEQDDAPTVHAAAAEPSADGQAQPSTQVPSPRRRPTNAPQLLYRLNRMPSPAEFSLLVATLEAHGFRRAVTPEEEATALLLWCGTSTVPPRLKLDGSPLPKCTTVNRLGCGPFLTHKDQLIMSLRRGQQTGLAPLTFKLPPDLPRLLRHQNSKTENAQETWIVKPYSKGCGRGIFVTHDLSQQVSRREKCLVSRYVTEPLLVEGKKLDLRLFVLVLAETPPNETAPPPHSRTGRKAYISRHGLVRFAAKDFGLSDLQSRRQDDAKVVAGTGEEDGGAEYCHAMSAGRRGGDGTWDPMVHLTYINSKNKRLHRQQRARQWTLQQLLDWLAQHPHYGQHRAHELWRAIRQLALRTVQCLPTPTTLLQSHVAHLEAPNSRVAADPPHVEEKEGEKGGDGKVDVVVREGGCEEEGGGGGEGGVEGGEIGGGGHALPEVKEERRGAFELFGFDVLPDAQLRPWLLEVRLRETPS